MYKLQVNTERKSEISEEELPDIEGEEEFNYFEDEEYEQNDEPEEREYCD